MRATRCWRRAHIAAALARSATRGDRTRSVWISARSSARCARSSPDVVVNLVESLAGRGELLARRAGACSSRSGCRSRAAPRARSASTSHKLAGESGCLQRAGIPTPGGVRSAARRRRRSMDREVGLGARVARARRRLGGHAARTPCALARGTHTRVRRPMVRGAIRAGPRAQRRDDRRARRAARVAGRRDSFRGFSARQAARSSATRRSGRSTASSTATRSASSASSAALAARADELALDCWELFALDGYARVDLRVDAAGHAVGTRGQRESVPVARRRVRRGAGAGRHRLSTTRSAGCSPMRGGARGTARTSHDATPRAFAIRSRPRPAISPALRRLVAATGVFYPEERTIALELLDGAAAPRRESGYSFFFAEQGGELVGYCAWGGAVDASAATTCTGSPWRRLAKGKASVRRCMRLVERAVARAGRRRLLHRNLVAARLRAHPAVLSRGRVTRGWHGCGTSTRPATIRSCFVR